MDGISIKLPNFKSAELQALPSYQKILGSFGLGALLLDESGKILAASQQIAEDLGYSLEELAGKRIFDINPHMSVLQWKKYWKQLKEKGSLAMESEYMTAEEMLFPVLLRGLYIEEEQQAFALLGVKNQLDANRYKDLLELAARVSKLGGWEWDLVHDEIRANKEIYNLIGLHPDNPLFANRDETVRFLQERLHPEEFAQLEKKLHSAIVDGKSFEQEVILKIPDGSFRRLTLNAVPVTSELQTIKLYGTLQDISFLDARNEDLHLTKFTLDHAREMIFWELADGSISYANNTVSEKLGYSQQEVLSMKGLDLVHEFSAESRQATWKSLRQNSEADLEATLRAKDGTLIPVYCSMNLIRFKGEEINCVFASDWRRKKEREAELEQAINKVRELSEKLREENTLLKEEINLKYNFNNIISQSDKYKKVLKQVEQVAATDATVLIVGETGTGKELLARAIHILSQRDDDPLIKVNCAALPKDLIESELFGHEKGAFTGAYKQKKGRFELAHQGTIFLDEIGEMPLSLQTNLLRVLQEGEFERVGGTRTLKSDVRVIAATNRNLEKMVNEGNFREDLFYRLNVFPIYNLPLRERREDIPLLVKHFVRKYSDKAGKAIDDISQAALRKLMNYDFPGNIRELENIIERAVILTTGSTLNLKDGFPREKQQQDDFFRSFEDMQRDYIIEALRRTNWRVTGPQGAARLLKLNDRTLASKMRRLNIRRKDFIGEED